MTITVLDRPTRMTPSRGVIAPSLLKAAEQGGATAIRFHTDPISSLPPPAPYSTDPGAGLDFPVMGRAALDTPRAPAITDREELSSRRRSVPSLASDSRIEVLWRWFIVAWLAAGYVLTGVAYFLG